MGQAKLKKEKPQHRAGPHGHNYYCRNRCGTVVYVKNANETFNERSTIPLWGWCGQCKAAAVSQHAARVLSAVISSSATQSQARKTIQGSMRLVDGQRYDLVPALIERPAFMALPVGELVTRCATMFRHAPHGACDGNPDGMPDPTVGPVAATGMESRA